MVQRDKNGKRVRTLRIGPVQDGRNVMEEELSYWQAHNDMVKMRCECSGGCHAIVEISRWQMNRLNSGHHTKPSSVSDYNADKLKGVKGWILISENCPNLEKEIKADGVVFDGRIGDGTVLIGVDYHVTDDRA